MNGTGKEQVNCAETVPVPLSLAGLIDEYTTHKASTYHKLRYHVRKNHDQVLRRLRQNQGTFALSDIRASTLQIWYDTWSEGGKISMAHTFMAALRTMFGFGLLMLEEKECERLCITMNKLRFKQSPPREVWLTAPQVDAIRRAAREHFGWHSLALAQALQFELMFRQKDIIGEWVPDTEPGESDVRHNGEKWLRGLRWSEITDNMVLRHITSKKLKPIEVDLKRSPMVLEELAIIVELPVEQLSRSLFPAGGPIVICDTNGLPWSANEYRRKWRLVANHVGIPKEIRNQDTRAGAITEATEAGANIEHVRHAATHTDIAQTQHYARGGAAKIATVQDKRLEHRKHYRTEE